MPDETQEKPADETQPDAETETPAAQDEEEAPEKPADETQPDAETETPAAQDEEEAEDQLPENTVLVEDAGTLKKKVAVTILRERIDGKFNEMFGELSSSAQVPGFRIGRAPRRLIEKRFGKEVSQDVRNALIGESIGDAIKKSDLKTLGEPDIDLDAIELPDTGDMEFSFEVEVSPEFDLPETKGIQVEKPSIEIDDARVAAALEQWRTGQARYEATDAAAQEGDMVVAGAKITGEGLEEADRPGLSLRVAPGQIEGLPLVDLGKELAGKKAGGTATLTLKAPGTHPNEEWREKELTIAITISEVRRRVLPEMDEAFAQAHGMESLQELRDQVRRDLQGRVAADVERSMRDQICQYLLDGTKFDLPEGVVTRHSAQVLRRRAVDLLMRGVPRERIDENLTELQAAASQEAERELRLTFILTKIAEAEEVEISEEEINSRIAQMAGQYRRRPERLRQKLAQDGRLGQLAVQLTEEKALNRLVEQAQVTEVAPEEPGEQDQDKPKAKEVAKQKAAVKSEKKSVEKSKPKKPQADKGEEG